jgi:hypothetical protein
MLLATVAVLMLSALAIAVPGNQQLGPYTVSFDVNADYQIQDVEPIETDQANAYQMIIFTDNTTSASISVTEYKALTDATLDVHKSLMPMNMILQGLNVTSVEDKTIDGKDGFLVSSVPYVAADAAQPNFDVYRAMYWLDSQGCECGPVSVGKTSVIVTSTYPMDVTEGLLNSLHLVAA